MKIVAVIPARSGSTGIPNKNIKKLCGKPLIAWAIERAKQCQKIDRVILSTNSEEYSEIGKEYGAEVPFLRPDNISVETSGIESCLLHTFEWLKQNEGYTADYLCLLLPTNPMRQVFHLDEAIKLVEQEDLDSVVSVNEVPANHTPYWSLVEDEKGIRFFIGRELEDAYTRRQDFPNACYARNDILYLVRPSNLLAEKSNLYGKKVKLYHTDAFYEADLNTEDEWIITENLFNFLEKKGE